MNEYPAPGAPCGPDGLPMHNWWMNPDRCADHCDDQLPTFSTVGRGLKGDGFKVKVSDPDTECETHLEGMSYDEATKQWHSDWLSENINGGQLTYQYKLRPFGGNPNHFTITFIYRRPGRKEWSWTTPSIPYVWNINEDGNITSPDKIVGSGIATIFLRPSATKPWAERLVYPPGTTRADYNAPAQGEAWTSNITFGKGGDVELPNFDELAKILGISVSQIFNILENKPGQIAGSDNIKDYIDDKDKELSDHIHADMGFPGGFLPGDGGATSIKKYIDDIKAATDEGIASDNARNLKTFTDILNKIFGGGTINPTTGAITWPNTDKIAVGNMNLYSGGAANWIKTDTDGENDARVE